MDVPANPCLAKQALAAINTFSRPSITSLAGACSNRLGDFDLSPVTFTGELDLVKGLRGACLFDMVNPFKTDHLFQTILFTGEQTCVRILTDILVSVYFLY